MQTIEQVTDKVQDMMHSLEGAINDDIRFLLQSEVIDLKDFDNDYRLPKILIHAAFKRAANSYAPLPFDQEAYAMIESLLHF